jgi:uncharacterized protein
MADPAHRFWLTVPMDDMSVEQWESLCDGCGRCCVIALEDEVTGETYHTDVACRLLDCATARCRDYPNRQRHVPDCIQITPETVGTLTWLPETCGYVRVYRGQDLPNWHPLRGGGLDGAVKAGVGVAGRVVSEAAVTEDELHLRLVDWDKGPGA